MNERIRELAEQAKAFILESEHAKIAEVSEVSFDKYSDLEKFAELIVKECSKIATNPYLNDEESYYGNEFAKAIKQHFGVEE